MKLVPYLFPHWFESHHLVQKHFKHVAKKIPRYRIELLSKPTPIQKIVSARQSCSSLVKTVSSHYELLIKRDDLTHRDVHMQGNKLRKLEFIFAQVLSSNAKHVLTAGGLQSNHCRTVAAVAAQLGLQSHLFLRSPHSDATQVLFISICSLMRKYRENMYLKLVLI